MSAKFGQNLPNVGPNCPIGAQAAFGAAGLPFGCVWAASSGSLCRESMSGVRISPESDGGARQTLGRRRGARRAVVLGSKNKQHGRAYFCVVEWGETHNSRNHVVRQGPCTRPPGGFATQPRLQNARPHTYMQKGHSSREVGTTGRKLGGGGPRYVAPGPIKLEKCSKANRSPQRTQVRQFAASSPAFQKRKRDVRVVLVATVQVAKQHSGDWDTVRSKCWQAFRQRFWHVRGYATAKKKACFGWPSTLFSDGASAAATGAGANCARSGPCCCEWPEERWEFGRAATKLYRNTSVVVQDDRSV